MQKNVHATKKKQIDTEVKMWENKDNAQDKQGKVTTKIIIKSYLYF